MAERIGNLLTEPLFGLRSQQGTRSSRSLPGVLAALGADEVASFTGLQAHQSHSWHALLVQLAALALHQAGLEDARQDEDRWRALLLSLTQGEDAAWCLVVPQLDLPAFLQPPVPEGSLDGFKDPKRAPDSLDLLATAKNHDVKQARAVRPRPEHWVFALVSLQTMEGYGGVANYGIARMNGGLSNRPCLAAAPTGGPGRRFAHDVAALLRSRPELVGDGDVYTEVAQYRATGGHALLWLLPWDGTESVPIFDCDPFFIEVCRRIRLTCEDGQVQAWRAGSKTTRLAAEGLSGRTGDLWTPINREESKALTVDGGGFHYRRLQELLFGANYVRPPALEVRPEDGPEVEVVAMTLVRGQGKTEGWHERHLPLPPAVKKILLRRREAPGEAELLGVRSRAQVEAAGALRARVLRPALCALLQAGADKLDLRDTRPDRWLAAFEQEVDQAFFDALWTGLHATRDDQEALTIWQVQIIGLAERQLNEAMRAAPLPTVRRYRAFAAAEGMFEGSVRKVFPEAAQRLRDSRTTSLDSDQPRSLDP